MTIFRKNKDLNYYTLFYASFFDKIIYLKVHKE